MTEFKYLRPLIEVLDQAMSGAIQRTEEEIWADSADRRDFGTFHDRSPKRHYRITSLRDSINEGYSWKDVLAETEEYRREYNRTPERYPALPLTEPPPFRRVIDPKTGRIASTFIQGRKARLRTGELSERRDLRGRTTATTLTGGEARDRATILSGEPTSTKGRESERGKRNITRNTAIVMLGLILSKLIGQLREILVIPTFGEGRFSEAFVQGFLLPDLIYQLLIGGSIQAAIIPWLSGALRKGEERKGWRALSIFITFAGLITFTAVVLGEILAGSLMSMIAHPEAVAYATGVARMLFPQVIFMMLAALSMGILNAHQRFTATAFAPALYNLGVVLSIALLGGPSATGLNMAALGVTLSALGYFLWQAAIARHELRYFRPSLDWRDPGFRSLLAIALPTLISASIPQVNTIVINAFMKVFPEGTPAFHRNAVVTWHLPWGIFAVAVSKVMLPQLSELDAVGDDRRSSILLSDSLRRALYLTIPSGLFFFAARFDVAQGIFQWGKVSDNAIKSIAVILSFYCFAIITHTVVNLMNNAFYAANLTKVPLIAGLASLLITGIGGYILTQHTAMGPSSLSFSFLMSSFALMLILLSAYKHYFPQRRPRNLSVFLLKAGGSAAVSAVILYLFGLLTPLLSPMSKLVQLIWLALRFVLAALVYILLTNRLDLPESRNLMKKLRMQRD
ncbi:MAG: murein biosynthesis integral membrane protein MurJ [Clostridiaceae bacterium]|nr:murein biosynthesis integral membrane protein MurJ [Clostridiaceae bacterium]